MTDISAVQEQWKKELGSLLEDEKKAVYRKNEYLEKLEAYHAKYDDAHGFSRLKRGFLKMSKVPWLRRKKMKLEKELAIDETKIRHIAIGALYSLADTVAKDSINGTHYKYLDTAVVQIHDTRDLVEKAAKKCRNASAVEFAAGVGDEIPAAGRTMNNSDDTAVVLTEEFIKVAGDVAGMWSASRAKRAFREAEIAVQSLQQTIQQEMPRVDGSMAHDISMSNTLMMNAFGGILSTMANWQQAGQLNEAKNHLRNVADRLNKTLNQLDEEKKALATAALKEARKTDKAVDDFATTLENYTLPPAMRGQAAPGYASPENTSLNWEAQDNVSQVPDFKPLTP